MDRRQTIMIEQKKICCSSQVNEQQIVKILYVIRLYLTTGQTRPTGSKGGASPLAGSGKA